MCERAAPSNARVAIYHINVKLITRGAGRSATAASAYRAADHVPDERTGLVFDYSRKRGVEHTEIVLPAALAGTADWARDRVRLWNAAEAAEVRKDARVAREYEVALPHELKPEERRDLVRAFARELADRHGAALDVAIHAPHREGDARNHHAHILATTRRVTESGLGIKTDIELKDADRARKGLGPGRVEVKAIRERWATLVNEHLAERGHAVRVDHRSLADQGVDREPTRHKGPAVTAIERRGERSVVAERIRDDEVAERLSRAVEAGRLEREAREVARSILDTTSDLKAAIAERDAERTRSLDEIRGAARAEWLARRAEHAEVAAPQATERNHSFDLTGDLAAARRVSREQWLAQRNAAHESTEPITGTGQAAEKPPRRLILPDDDLSK